MSVEQKEVTKIAMDFVNKFLAAVLILPIAGIPLFPYGSPLLKVSALAVYIFCIAAAVRYFFILDGARPDAEAYYRERYLNLWARLVAGGTPAKVYNTQLERALNAVDRFFGDSDRADKSWFTRVLGWDARGARWTAPAYDRCLLLALVYPVASILLFWGFFGEVGVAEKTLGLAHASPPARCLATAALMMSVGFWAAYARTSGWRSWVYFALGISAAAAAAFAGAGAFAGAVAVAVAFAGAGAVAVAVAIAQEFFAGRGRQGLFLTCFTVVALFACFVGVWTMAPMPRWTRAAGPLLLFLGLFTLVNAPFDWLALGFTRALLRRGLSRGGWQPFLYALIDLFVAAALMFGLAFAMVIAAQTFDDIAVLRGGEGARILPLEPLFKSLHENPTAPQNLWVWVLMFSSMIPSVVNFAIAALSFLRGLPVVHDWVLARLPVESPVNGEDRLAVSAVLAFQVAGGVALTMLAVYGFVAGLLPYVLPWFGGVLNDFGASLADANFPKQLMEWPASHR